MSEMPDDIRELDRKLRSVRFEPRHSFGPELFWRLRRGERHRGAPPTALRRHLATAAVALLAAGSALALGRPGLFAGSDVTIDRCCYDLDGGGEADDGVVVHAERDARVHRLRVYEDLDGSRSYTTPDLLRLDRGAAPAVHGLAGEGIVTIERCCLDFDGGGPDDDGLLVVGVPPDRVLMAAIYETGSESGRKRSRDPGWPLR